MSWRSDTLAATCTYVDTVAASSDTSPANLRAGRREHYRWMDNGVREPSEHRVRSSAHVVMLVRVIERGFCGESWDVHLVSLLRWVFELTGRNMARAW